MIKMWKASSMVRNRWSAVLALIALFSCCGERTSPAGAEPDFSRVDEYAVRFDRMNQRVNGGMGYCSSLNTNGELAWGEASILLGYIEMYRATRDRAYLDSFIEHFDKVLANRDDRHRRIDFYRKAPVAGWGS